MRVENESITSFLVLGLLFIPGLVFLFFWSSCSPFSTSGDVAPTQTVITEPAAPISTGGVK